MTSIWIRRLGVGLLVCGATAATVWADEPPPAEQPTTRAVRQLAPAVQAPSVTPVPSVQSGALAPAPVQAPTGTAVRLPPPIFQLQPPPANSWRAAVSTMPALPPLQGFVDLHTHPMSFLGFGGKLLYGAADVGGILPPAPGCAPPVALNPLDALGHENDWYGLPGPGMPFGPGTSTCANMIRFGAIQAIEAALGAAFYPPPAYMSPLSGPPLWTTWPAWNDVLRQKMWIDWVQRAYQGGLRVMVALAVNNRLLGDVVLGGNSASDLPTGDAQSADMQLIELGNYVNRHNTWMALVHNSTELYNAVAANKLAVIAGVEIDNIGGLVDGGTSGLDLNRAIDHLYALGARYIFPVHLVDNPIGKTAAYEDMFMVANAYEEQGRTMHLACVPNISYNYSAASARVAMLLNSGLLKGWQAPLPVVCGPGMGNINAADHDQSGNVIGLTAVGRQAIQHMMDLGMLIDVDHMSQASVDQTLAMAQANLPTQYPMMSGHNNVRGNGGPGSTERQLRADQYQILGALHGMAGIGSAKTTADGWLATLQATAGAMNIGAGPGVAFGTDADGMEFMMPPRQGSNVNPGAALPPPAVPLPMSRDGTKTWDYNHDGVAHYGLLPDYLNDVGSLTNNGGPAAVQQMFGGAQYIYQTWYIAERDKKL